MPHHGILARAMKTPRGRNGSGKDNWRTPPEFLDNVRKSFGVTFDVDCAADAQNSVAPMHYSETRSFLDAQEDDLVGLTCWCNPPFSMMHQFIPKILSMPRATVFLLGPGVMDPAYTHLMLTSDAYAPVFVLGRLAFIHPDTGKKVSGNPVGSVLFVPRPLWSRHGSFSIARNSKA